MKPAAALLCFLFALTASAGAEEAMAPAQPPADVICTRIDLSKPLTAADLQNARLCEEVSKLREEVAAIQKSNKATEKGLGILLPWMGIITGAMTGFAAILVPLIGLAIRRSFEKSQQFKLDQEKTLQREEHNLRLMEGLGSPNRAVQLACVSSLLRRIAELQTDSRRRTGSETELKTLSDVVVSVLRDPQIDESVAKYLADEMVNVFALRRTPGANGRNAGPPANGLKLSEFNMQRTRLRNVYWAGVQAGGVDFFKADLTGASLRGAQLENAVFYETDLRDSVLSKADLSGCNFQGADLRGARLNGANLEGATNLELAVIDSSTRWDSETRWPAGFSPALPADSN